MQGESANRINMDFLYVCINCYHLKNKSYVNDLKIVTNDRINLMVHAIPNIIRNYRADTSIKNTVDTTSIDRISVLDSLLIMTSGDIVEV